jgi:hypothetical protein
VIVHELHVGRTGRRPPEHQPELVVHADRMLSRPITRKGLQPVARRNVEILQNGRRLQDLQFSLRRAQQVGGKPLPGLIPSKIALARWSLKLWIVIHVVRPHRRTYLEATQNSSKTYLDAIREKK